jgi:filamentous hemagglutinin family protein
MNHIYRSLWNDKTGTFVAVSEITQSGKKASTCGGVVGAVFALKALAASLLLAYGATGYALPVDGAVVAGGAAVSSGNGSMTVTQTSQNAVLNWQQFNIGQGEAVRFVQPNSSAVALNRVLGADPSSILGSLSANGKVFLVNPNGILFGAGASVNVGGLVASTRNISDSDFMAGNYKFAGGGTGSVLNQGTINADGGYVALLGANVSNDGTISARLGTVALAAGNGMTLDVAGDGLLNVAINEGAVNALVQNGGMIRADGGQVLLTAQAAGDLLHTVVNNTGVIQAQTIENHNGVIKLLGDMQSGTVNVGGTLDASAPNGGDGGFIETSAAHVKVNDNARITTSAPQGLTGSWLIDPVDFTIAASGGDMTGAAVTTALGLNNFTIQSTSGSSGSAGDINVNDTVSWSSSNKLTLNAQNNINIRANLSVTSQGRLALEFGQGALAAGNTSNFITMGGVVNLFVLATFTTKQGSDGAVKSYLVINSLGTAGSTNKKNLQGMSGGMTSNYVLGANIDATATSGWNAGAGFLPIGDNVTPYTGTFNGLGHTISNLTINRPTTDQVGLFGKVDTGGSVQNIGLVGGSVTGKSMVGGLVGNNNYGTISNSYTTGAVHGSGYTGGLVGNNYGGAISNSYATGAVTGAVGGGSYIGGLVGNNNYGNSTISNSYASGAVSSTGSSVGGLAGRNNGTVSNSYASGAVSSTGSSVGGLIGYNASTISNSYASGAVSGSSSVGGVAGINNGTVAASFWNKTTSGQATSAGGVGMTTAQMQTQANFTSATAANGNVNPGWDFANTWVAYDGHTSPLLRSFMTALTVTANNATKTYDGLAYSGGNGATYSTTPNGNLLGTLSYGGTSQSATNAGSYAITGSGLYSNQQGYLINYVAGGLTVNKANLTLGSGNVSKTYDGGLTAAGTATVSSGTLFGADALSGGTFAFTDKNAGSNKTVTTSGVTVSDGNGGGNYNVAYADNTGSTITPKALTVAGETARNKVYDGTTLATLAGGTLAGLISGDTVTLIEAGTFATPNAGNGIAVAAAVSLGGPSAGNYSVIQPTGLTANITAPANTNPGSATDSGPRNTAPATTNPVSVTDSDLRYQAATASTASLMSAVASQGSTADAPSSTRTGDAPPTVQTFASSTPGGLTGLNLSITGNGVKLPSGVQPREARDDKD